MFLDERRGNVFTYEDILKMSLSYNKNIFKFKCHKCTVGLEKVSQCNSHHWESTFYIKIIPIERERGYSRAYGKYTKNMQYQIDVILF